MRKSHILILLFLIVISVGAISIFSGFYRATFIVNIHSCLLTVTFDPKGTNFVGTTMGSGEWLDFYSSVSQHGHPHSIGGILEDFFSGQTNFSFTKGVNGTIAHNHLTILALFFGIFALHQRKKRIDQSIPELDP